MRLAKLTLTGALAGMALLASTGAMAASSPTCLRGIDVYNFNATNHDKTLIIETTRHKKYKLSLIGMCWNMNMKEQIALRTIGGSDLSCISKGDQVIVHDLGMRQTCSITNITPYTKAMEAADKAAKAAKKAEKQSY